MTTHDPVIFLEYHRSKIWELEIDFPSSDAHLSLTCVFKENTPQTSCGLLAPCKVSITSFKQILSSSGIIRWIKLGKNYQLVTSKSFFFQNLTQIIWCTKSAPPSHQNSEIQNSWVLTSFLVNTSQWVCTKYWIIKIACT